ncbi:MAG TPA: DUF58 domain-containing protein [Candidatus Acidoferrum sp.]|nr:DUF58 domain-containing protein [Candidatus Acidoferrum sp.]
MSKLLRLWPSARALWALAAIAILLACSPGAPICLPLAMLFAAVLFVALIADSALLPPPRDVHVRRELPAHFSLRRSAELRYLFENRSRRALRIGLVEAPLRTLDLGEAELVTGVPARSEVTAAMTVLPVARGSDRFTHIYLWYESTLGLVRRRMTIDAPAMLRVYPDLSAVERYGSLQVRNRLVEAGLRRMRLRGVGSEFESVRDYESGDGFRSIDWKATARRGKLMVVQREVERSQDVMLLLDCGRLMTARIGAQRKLDYAVTAGLSMASIASLASDRVGVVAFAAHILVARAPRSTTASVRALADALCDVEPRFEESDYARAFAYLRSHLHRRSLIAFFTDVIDPVAQSAVLAELGTLAKRHVVLCIFMNDAAVSATLAKTPHSVNDAFGLGVALGLSLERTAAARTLQRSGIIVLDVPAEKLTIAAVDEYLRVKSRGLL